MNPDPTPPTAIRRVAIIAGEASGDQLGGDLIAALRRRHPAVDVFGMAGPRMRAAGCRSLAGIDELAVMGLVEVLRHYPRLLRLRTRLVKDLLAARPDVLVGIDVPDFTLDIERQARAAGIPAVHYVCPQVWAWRPGRLPRIREAVDLVLALFPFEVPFLGDHQIEAAFVGHPLADRIPLEIDRTAARASLLPAAMSGPLIALLPGSRRQELTRHVDLFLLAALLLASADSSAQFAAGAVDERAADFLRARASVVAPHLPLTVLSGQSTRLLAAADVALLASGTITLEAALSGTPAVVAYRLAPISFWWMRRAVKVPHVALPNLLLGQRLLPEFLQHEATPAALAGALQAWLADADRRQAYRAQCGVLHQQLRVDSGDAAVAAIERLLERLAGSGR